MVETFSIQEEKFVNQVYYLTLGVSFNKKNFQLFRKKNIYPSQIKDKKFLFIPIIVDEKADDLIIFSKNPIFNNWNSNIQSHETIKYLLPSEDLEDLSLIKKISIQLRLTTLVKLLRNIM